MRNQAIFSGLIVHKQLIEYNHKRNKMEIHKKRRKLKKRDFNLSAMKELIEKKTFLNAKYDKLAINAEERFGYHWNEVICNVLYNKYVKTNPELLDEYRQIKLKKEREKEKIKVISTIKDIRPDIPVPQPTPQIANIEPIKTQPIKEMTSSGGGSVGDGAPTGNNSGAYATPVAWSPSNEKRRFFINPTKGYKIIKNKTPKNTIMKETNKSKLDNLFEEFNKLVEDFEQNLNSDGSYEPIEYTFHIVSYNDNDFYADVRNKEKETIYQITSKKEKDTIMEEAGMKTMEEEEDIEKLKEYLVKEGVLKNNDELKLSDVNKELKTNLEEEVKPNGMVQAERIKQINNKNSLNYYKELNSGIQDMINAKKEVGEPINKTIKYDYDNGKVEDATYPYEEENNNEYYKTAHRGTEDYILDVPNKKYDERLKKMVGTKPYNILKDKQNIIKKMDLRNTQKAKTEVVDHLVKESYLSGFYFDNLNNKKIKTTALSKVETANILTEDLKYFETKGVGNAFDEILKEEIENYNFYYNLKEDKFVKIAKQQDTNSPKTILKESSIKKLNKLINYNPSKYVMPIVDRSVL